MNYVFDSSAWIAWWHEIYPLNSFPDIHKLIEHDITQGFIISPAEVKKELQEQVKDELTNCVTKQSDLFIRDDENLQDRIAKISNDYPKLVKQHRKFNADPIVIALAEQRGWAVVTQENPNRQNNMVGCCRDLNLTCLSLTQYIQQRTDVLENIRQDLWTL